jgi:DNA-binding NarL/FixJ family response regulator
MGLRILIADDHEHFRRGLRAFIQRRPDWERVGEAADGQEAIEKAEKLGPDMVLLDIGMPQVDGFEASRRIRKALPGAEILILSQHDSKQHTVCEGLKSGARGYVLKSDAAQELLPALEALGQHKAYFSSTIARYFVETST